MIYATDTSIDAQHFVNKTSRYIDSKVRKYTEEGILTFETYKRKKLPLNRSDQFAEITEQFQYRPDLVAFKVYGSPDFWWKLMEYNGMKDILEFKKGVVLRLPGNILY